MSQLPLYPLYQVDAFSDTPFHGNPAAVCLLEGPRDPSWMQQVAAEMNLAETAFLVPRPDGSHNLRWFTPGAEVALCGHATLASAHVLWETGRLAPDTLAVFHTKSGELRCERQGERVAMDFPALVAKPTDPVPWLAEALGAEPVAWHHVDGEVFQRFLLELESEAALRALAPDFRDREAWSRVTVIATARADTPGIDFVSRFFAPAVGVEEDPATGSAHCALAPYWAERLGREQLSAFQASPRGAHIEVHARGERVGLAGHAVTVLEGRLRV